MSVDLCQWTCTSGPVSVDLYYVSGPVLESHLSSLSALHSHNMLL